jgi:hypothetical protein
MQFTVQKQVLMIRREESPYHPILRYYIASRKYTKILRETHHHSFDLGTPRLFEAEAALPQITLGGNTLR